MIRDGVKLQFSRDPRPFRPRSIPVKPEHRPWLHAELDRLIALGAYEEATCRDYISAGFIVEQSKLRLVIALNAINTFCVKQSCRYESLGDLKHLMQPNDYMFSLDLADGYYMIPIHPDHRKYLTFEIDGRVLQCAALPFGSCQSPLVFTKVMRVFVRFLRMHGVRVLPYLDDLIFFVNGSYTRALRARALVEKALNLAGLKRNEKKGTWEPTTCIKDHLGMEIDSVKCTIRAPARRCDSVAGQARALIALAARTCRRVPVKQLQRFTGSAVSTSLAITCARFRLRSLHDAPKAYGFATLPRQALTDLRWWSELHLDHPANGSPIFTPTTTRTLFVDASGTTGWGAELRGPGEPKIATGFWSDSDRRFLHSVHVHITFKELRTLRLSFMALLPELTGQHVMLMEDNLGVVGIIRAGSSRSPELMDELRKLWALMDRYRITVAIQYVRSADNLADRWSRMRSRSAWQLRRSVFLRLQRRYGTRFTLDAFACATTAQLPRYCALHADPYALARDAFSLDWNREHLWLNPPWKELPRVLSKLKREGGRGVLLVPHWPSQSWYPALRSIARTSVPLPPVWRCVVPAHAGKLEPFCHPRLQLRAVYFDVPPPRV
jgi:hypothetical protein